MLNRFCKFIYRAGLHRDILSHARFKKTCRLFVTGEVPTLEIGSGGGPFTVELLERNNRLTLVEIDEAVAKRTQKKIDRWYPKAEAKVILGDACELDLGGPYHQAILLEVLEHVKDDLRLLRKVRDVLEPGGRLLISTPTASGGLLHGDYVSADENGAHVRVGYNGPELEYYLQKLGMVVVDRMHYGFWFSRFMLNVQRIGCSKGTKSAKRGVSVIVLLCYRLLRFLDSLYRRRPYGQILLAVKVEDGQGEAQNLMKRS